MKTKMTNATKPKKPQVRVQDLAAKRNPKAGTIVERYDQTAKNIIQSLRG